MHWKDWCWSWSSNILAIWCKELTHLGGTLMLGRVKGRRHGDDRGWDGWMASLTWCTWVWVNSGSWWWMGRPGVLQFMGLQRVGHAWVIELNWTYMKSQLIGKDPDAGKDWGQEEKGATEDEMVGWHHWLKGHEFEQTPGGREGQESLVCCSPWDHKDTQLSDWIPTFW